MSKNIDKSENRAKLSQSIQDYMKKKILINQFVGTNRDAMIEISDRARQHFIDIQNLAQTMSVDEKESAFEQAFDKIKGDFEDTSFFADKIGDLTDKVKQILMIHNEQSRDDKNSDKEHGVNVIKSQVREEGKKETKKEDSAHNEKRINIVSAVSANVANYIWVRNVRLPNFLNRMGNKFDITDVDRANSVYVSQLYGKIEGFVKFLDLNSTLMDDIFDASGRRIEALVKSFESPTAESSPDKELFDDFKASLRNSGYESDTIDRFKELLDDFKSSLVERRREWSEAIARDPEIKWKEVRDQGEKWISKVIRDILDNRKFPALPNAPDVRGFDSKKRGSAFRAGGGQGEKVAGNEKTAKSWREKMLARKEAAAAAASREG